MPASGNVLLDSSVVIPYLRGDVVVGRELRSASVLYISSIVLGELYCGAILSTNPPRVLAEIANLLIALVLLPVGAQTAEHYGRIRAALSRAGTPIPENDIWIAAAALVHRLPLAARDQHFDQIPGLQILKW